jgi:hypothetical protein
MQIAGHPQVATTTSNCRSFSGLASLLHLSPQSRCPFHSNMYHSEAIRLNAPAVLPARERLGVDDHPAILPNSYGAVSRFDRAMASWDGQVRLKTPRSVTVDSLRRTQCLGSEWK